jgi:tRNA(fMet)-specific endonuclease VapC
LASLTSCSPFPTFCQLFWPFHSYSLAQKFCRLAKTIPPKQIAITIVSIEELVRGRLAQIRKAAKPEPRARAYYWLSETFEFLCDFNILRYDMDAEMYFQTLRQQKIRIGSQDLKIGAIVLGKNATLVTRNRRDFEQIPNLRIEDWST